MIRSYRLQFQLEEDWFPARFIITGNEWFSATFAGLVWKKGDEFPFCEWTGIAIIYPEDNLLWLGRREDWSERFKTLENFEKEFNALPRWEATRYAVKEYVSQCDEDGRILSVDLMLYDCRAEQRLVDDNTRKPVPGREAEVARLRRGIEPMMRGESFSFM